jgi:hypothetical protein
MKSILPIIRETIAINESTFVDHVKGTLSTVELKGWNAKLVIETDGSSMTIRTKRHVPIPFDAAILRGTIDEGRFSYEIRPRKVLFLLVPWYLFVFAGLVVSIVAAFSFANALIPVAAFAAMIFVSWRNISANYRSDLLILRKVIEKNKKHST